MPAPASTSLRLDPAASAAIERAVAEGRHSSSIETVCGGCGDWVHAIYHVTIDKKRLCQRCFELQSGSNQTIDLAAASRSSRGERSDEPTQTRPVAAAVPTGQSAYGRAASHAAETPPAAARPGVDMRPGPGPTSTVACPSFTHDQTEVLP